MTQRNFFYYTFLFLTLIFSPLFISAQTLDEEDNEETETYSRINPRHSISLELGLPVAIRNKNFNGYMQGIVNISPYYHYSFKNRLTTGLGVNYNYFWINHVLTNDTKNLGGIQALGAFVRIGYEKFYSDRYGIDLNVKIGQSTLIFDSDNNRKLSKLPTMNIFVVEPSICFVVTADDQSSYRWVVSYTAQKYNFDPTLLGFVKDVSTANSSPATSFTQFLTVGFGYTYYIKQR
jgi:hypothetical protein